MKHFYADGLQVAKMVASNVYYLHEDALGSVRLVATATVTVRFSSNYLPYGSNHAMVGTEVFMYTGKMYDAATGLYYLMARCYDPTLGRFITEDSYGGDENDPMTMNRYIYASDNPERYSDPDGHMFVVETDSGQEVGGDYLYTPAVVETVTVTNSESERKRNEYYAPPSAWNDPHGIEGTWAPFATTQRVPGSHGIEGVWAPFGPTIGIESSTSTYPFAHKCGIGPCHMVPNPAGVLGAMTVSEIAWAGVGVEGLATFASGVNAPFLVISIYGATSAQMYVQQNINSPNISAEGAAEAWGRGAVSGALSWGLGRLLSLFTW